MAPRHVRGSNSTRSQDKKTHYFKHGDLVMVKTADYPAWPAVITRPEYFKRTTDTWRYCVQLFGIHESAFVEPYNIELFTGEVKIRPQGKSNVAKNFATALKEIAELFEKRRRSALEDKQTSARLELENKAAGKRKTSALSESNGEDSISSIRNLVALAKEAKLKRAPSQRLSQNVPTTPKIGSAVQPGDNVCTGGSISTDAIVARDAFRGIMETLSESRNSIDRATRLASDCAKNGNAHEVIQLIMEKLEKEQSMHGRVKFLFLVDSIMKHLHRQKGFAGTCFVTVVQDQLPRLLGSAAPLWVTPRENHKQCAQILRLWIKRKIIQKSYLQPYIDDIELLIRNSSLEDRPVIQPRLIDGILIEEYGSNIDMLQLPGDLLSHMSVEEDEIHKISCCQKREMKDYSAEGNGLDGRERNSPPSPPDSPPLTPPLPLSPMPPPTNPTSSPPPPQPLPSRDPIRYSSQLQRPPPPIMGPWGQQLMPQGERPIFSYFWRPA